MKVQALQVIAAGETERRRTEIWSDGHRHEWRRTDKSRPWGLNDTRRELVEIAAGHPATITPRIEASTLTFEVPRLYPLAFGTDGADASAAARVLAHFALSLHEHGGEATEPTDTLVRLRAAASVRPGLQEHAREVERALNAFKSASEQRLLHGDLGLGSIVARADSFAIVTGDHLCWGPREFDIGWLLGDLLEHARLRGRDENERRFAREAGRVFLTDYRSAAGQIDAELVHSFLVCRLLSHAHDAAEISPAGFDAILPLVDSAESWLTELREGESG